MRILVLESNTTSAKVMACHNKTFKHYFYVN